MYIYAIYYYSNFPNDLSSITSGQKISKLMYEIYKYLFNSRHHFAQLFENDGFDYELIN